MFDRILELPGAAPVLAAKIAGRVIGQVARGFGKDKANLDELNLFKAIEEKYPDDTFPIADMFKKMLDSAPATPSNGMSEAVANLPEAERTLWVTANKSDKQKLLDALPEISALFHAAKANPDSWNDLTVIAQWSLLNALEAALPGKIELYQGWLSKDRNKDGKSARLLRDAMAAQTAVYDIVTEFLDDEYNQEALAEEAERGVAVPVRTVQAA
jgi:hypothetical protein